MSKYKKIINGPSLGIKHKDLPKEAKGIITDRGKEFTYAISFDGKYNLHISCILPSGLILTGIAYKHPNDDPDPAIGVRTAAGKLEGSLRALRIFPERGQEYLAFGRTKDANNYGKDSYHL